MTHRLTESMRQNKQLTELAHGSLHGRIMRRVIPLIVVAMLIATAVTIITIQLQARSDITESVAIALDEVSLRVDENLAVMVADLRILSSNLPISSILDDQSDATEITNIANTFGPVIERSDYLSFRFITLDGVQRVSVSRDAAGSSVDTTPLETDLATDPIFITISSGITPGTAYLGPISEPTEEYPAGVFNIYVPVANPGNRSTSLGVLELRVDASRILNVLDETVNSPGVEQDGRRVALINGDNRILLSGGADTFNNRDLSEYLADHSGEFTAGFLNFREVASTSTVADYPGTDTPWRIVIQDDILLILSKTIIQSVVVIVVYIVLTIIILSILSTLLRAIVSPVNDVARTARMIAGGMGDFSKTLVSVPGDEVGQIVQSMEQLSFQVRSLNEEIGANTQRFNNQMNVVERIGRDISDIYDLQRLLPKAMQLISTEFNLFHSRLFRIDDLNINAVIAYTYTKVIDPRPEPEKVPVGGQHLVGRVAKTGKPMFVSSVVHDETNDVQEKTRRQMILPLIIGNRVIAVLDLQSREYDQIKKEDVPIFMVLANQLASAVNNAVTISDSQERITRLDELSRQLTRDAWSQGDGDALSGQYNYNLLNVDYQNTLAPNNGENGNKHRLSSPITVRGEAVGSLVAEPEEGQGFTEGDALVLRAVADRVALAIENARLFRETQSSLAETSILYDLSRALNESTTLEEIVNAIIGAVMPDASGGQVWIFDEYSGSNPGWMTIQADVAHDKRQENNDDLVGLRLHIPDHTFLASVQSNRVSLVQNAREDDRLDAGLKLFCRRANGVAMVFVPFIIRGQWRGLLSITFAEARRFTEQEGRIYTLLIDQASVAIDNRLLLRQTEDALTLQENLYAASRIINQAQSEQDLVYAAVATAENSELNFSLALLEGELDADGWPTRAHFVAHSANGKVTVEDRYHPLFIAPDSPLRQREPLFLTDDTPNNNNIAEDILWMRDEGYAYMAIFPLFSVQQPIALFYVQSKELYDLTQNEYEIYRAMTGQMSTQLEIRRQVQRTELALDETRRLYLASSAIVSAQDSEEVYEVATEHLARPFLLQSVQKGMNIRIMILLAKPEATPYAPYLECVYAWHSNNAEEELVSGQMFSAGEYPYGRILETAGTAVSIGDILSASGEALGDFPELRAKLLNDDVGSMFLAPIESNLKWFGTLVCQSNQPNSFDEQYQRFAQAAVDQIAIAIDNKRLFEEARNEADRAQAEAQRALALAEAGQLANRIGVGNIEDSLNEVFQRVAEVSGFDRWMLALFDQRRDLLEAIITHLPGHDATAMEPLELTNDMTVVEAALEGRSIVVNRVPTQDTDTADNPFMNSSFGKHIAVPVISGRKILGSLMMGREFDKDQLDDRDEQLITTLAAQVAIALENRRLFQQAQSEQQRLQSILATLPAGVLVLDPQTMQPILYNEQAETYFGEAIDPQTPFSPENYNLYRSGTGVFYPTEEMPVNIALRDDTLAFADDVAVISQNSQIDLQFNAAPIHGNDGSITAIVIAFQDISALRSMENTLQENLRQTVTQYEIQVQLAEADGLTELLDSLVQIMVMFQPDDAYIIQPDSRGNLTIERALMQPIEVLDALTELFDPNYVVNIHDAEHYQLEDETWATLQALNIRNVISVPLRTRQRPAGWLLLVGSEAGQIGAEQEPILTQIGDSAATAIDNRFLILNQQQTLQEINTLYSATTTISRTRDIDQLGTVLQGALSTLKPDYRVGYILETTELGDISPILFDVRDDVLPSVDFPKVLSGHRIPPDGLFIDDLAALVDPTPLEQALIAVGNLRTVAIMNLRVKGNSGGALVIAFTTPRDFTEGEIRYLNTLVDSASVVLDNVQLFEQTQSTLEETTVLYQASRALTDAVDGAQILDVVVNYLIGSHITFVFIAMLNTRTWDNPAATVEVTADWHADDDGGLSLEGLVLTQDQFPAWRLLASQEVLMIDDILEDRTLDPMEQIGIESLDVRSLTVIPLRVASRSIGALWLASNEPYTHSNRDARLYQAFAEQASLSMEASYLLEQTERRARQLQTSAEVSQSAGNILDLEELLPRLVDLIQASFEYDHVQIFLMDDRDEWALLRASTGEAGKHLLGIKHKLKKGSSSVIGKVTQNGHPEIALDTADASVVHQPNPYLPLTRSEMALPIILKNRVVGALDVQSNQPNAFSDEDISALTTLAAQIAVALDNANLYKSSQEQAERMGFLFNVTRSAAAAETLEETLDSVVRRIYDETDALSASMYLKRVYIDDRTGNTHSTLRMAALAGSDQPLSEFVEIRMDDTNSIMGEVIERRSPRFIHNIEQESRYLTISPQALSAILVPLRSAGEDIGMVVLESDVTYGYGDDEARLLEALAGSVSAVIQSTQLLEQLTQTNEQLRELDRVKSDFLANMSHELRTPLNSIIGFSRVMLKGIDGALTEMQEQDLTTIYNSGQHLLMLINDILDQAKIASGKLDIKLEHFDVKLMIEAVKSIGVGLVKDKPVHLNVEVSPNMQKAYGDEFRIRQVMINLVSNAAKFTNEGQILIRAYPWQNPHTDKTMIRIDVTDSGIGIAEKDLPLLFEAFRQIDSSLTRTAGGTGLGLPIAKSLVEMQGGEMIVMSEINVGSTFSVTIPTDPDEMGADGDDTSPYSASNGHSDDTYEEEITKVDIPSVQVKKATQTAPMPIMAQKRDVLLIEDNKTMVDQFRRSLQREGFDVVTADHPSYAEAMVSNLRPTVLVMDVNFANSEGWHILKRLKDRDDTFDIPIVVVTLSDESERAYQLGAHTFIQRPFMPEQLVEAVLQAEKESNMERILIIDDQPESIRLLTAALNASGTYRVFSADNGREGISMVARRRPNLIILDLRMPEMDGFAVLQELRGNPETSNIPVMIVTGELDFNTDEQKVLENVHILHKTDITQEEYEQFIKGVQNHLNPNQL
ncbi:MAG: GAF domain-containing protein [Aggregatilineales bacterium]